jgi:cellulose synthase/poly-beta-1,6-N-acetylglucosamine synthase-like glycosyltransferase
MIVESFFWFSLGIVLYTYFFYPICLFFIKKIKRKKNNLYGADELPSVTVIISVYNEEIVLERKIENLNIVDYPKDKIEFLFGSDGANDNTNEILRSTKASNFYYQIFSARRGKAMVLNDLIKKATGDIVVFSDADTLFAPDTVKKLVTHFGDHSIGAVCGELLQESSNQSSGDHGEGFYRSYDNMIRQLESDIYSTVGATGAVYAIRRTLFQPLPILKTIADDFIIPIQILKQGFRVIYEAKAVGYEKPTNSIKGEFHRKVRLGASNFQGIGEYASLLSPRYGFISLALWSHKIFRWCVPFFLLLFAVLSFVLYSESALYRVVIVTEAVFFLLTLFGLIADYLKIRIGVLGFPYYFIAMNIALLVGFLKFLLKKQPPTWEVIR